MLSWSMLKQQRLQDIKLQFFYPMFCVYKTRSQLPFEVVIDCLYQSAPNPFPECI